MSRIFDLAVIGGGPAGTSAAITAAQFGFDVVLLEAGKFPRHKVCGEFVSGEALSILDRLLGVSPLLTDSPRICHARVFIDGRMAELPVSPAAASVTRYELDLRLWQAALEIGVSSIDRARVKAVRRESEYFLIDLEEAEFRARTVINASGRWSNIAAEKPTYGDHWIGLKAHVFEPDPPSSCDLYFFEGGYCGVQPVGSNTVNVAAIVRANVARSLPSVLKANPVLAERSRQWEWASESFSTAPLLFRRPRTSDRGIALAGDAAAFIDPFAGDGISIALHSGRLATLALAAYLGGEASIDAALLNYARAHRELIQPALRDAARLRRLAQLPKAFRLTAMSFLAIRPFARLAYNRTRVAKAS